MPTLFGVFTQSRKSENGIIKREGCEHDKRESVSIPNKLRDYIIRGSLNQQIFSTDWAWVCSYKKMIMRMWIQRRWSQMSREWKGNQTNLCILGVVFMMLSHSRKVAVSHHREYTECKYRHNTRTRSSSTNTNVYSVLNGINVEIQTLHHSITD